MQYWINEKLSNMTMEEQESFWAGHRDGSMNRDFNPDGHDFSAYKDGYDFGENSAWEAGGGSRM